MYESRSRPAGDAASVAGSEPEDLGPAIDDLATPIWVFDLVTLRIAWANRAALAFWKADNLAALRDRDFSDAMTPVVRLRLEELERGLRRGERLRETWTLHPDDEAVTVTCFFTPLPREGGSMAMQVEAHVVEDEATLQDRRAVEALRYAATIFLLIQDDGALISFNPLAAAWFPGLSGAQGSLVADILRLEETEARTLLSAMAERRAHSSEVEVPTAEGRRWMLLNARPIPDPLSGKTAYLIGMTDVTDRRRLEEERRHYENTLRQVVETAPVPLVVSRPLDGQLVYANAATADLFGVPVESLIGRPVNGYYLSTDARQEMVDRITEDGAIDRFNVTLCTARGRPFAASVSARIVSFKGEPAILAAITDVEADTVARRVLADALDRQTRLNEAHQEFVSMLSHEFMTPLSVIDGAARRVARRLKGPDEDGESAAWIQRIRDAAGRITHLVSEVLMAARSDNGLLTVTPEPTDVCALVETVVDRHQRIAPDHDIALETCGLAESIAVDPQVVDIVLSNLLSNAIKYSPGAGHIRVKVEGNGDGVAVAVADEGMGIPVNEMDRIFDRFYRCSSSGSIPGTGLGLDITKKLVELHGGVLWAESEYGRGSTFRFTLSTDRGEASTGE